MAPGHRSGHDILGDESRRQCSAHGDRQHSTEALRDAPPQGERVAAGLGGCRDDGLAQVGAAHHLDERVRGVRNAARPKRLARGELLPAEALLRFLVPVVGTYFFLTLARISSSRPS